MGKLLANTWYNSIKIWGNWIYVSNKLLVEEIDSVWQLKKFMFIQGYSTINQFSLNPELLTNQLRI